MQHLNIKLFVEDSSEIKLADAIAVFHRWIQTNAVPGLLIDVADYSHVVNGPGVVLIGHEAYYSLDQGKGRLGFLYQRKARAEGTDVENLRAAFGIARAAAALLEQEPEFAGKLRFRQDRLAITLNDRLLYPHTKETWEAVEPALRAVLDGYTLVPNEDPRERFEVLATRT
jgi:hypothetical protein